MKRGIAIALPLLIGGGAAADPAEESGSNEADQAFQSASDLKDAGQWAQACPKFEVAYHLKRTVSAMLNIADCDVHFQRLATARQHYSDAATDAQIKLADSHNTDTIAQRQLDAARAAIAELGPKIPKLHFTFSATRPASLHVVRNGVDITNLTDTDLLVDLEQHHVVMTADGKLPQTFDVDVVEPGRTYSVDVVPFQPAPLPAAPQLRERPDVVAARNPSYARSYIVVGVGGAALIGGVAIGLIAKSESGSASIPTQRSAYNLGNDGTVVGVIGVVGLAAGAALWIVTRSTETAPRAALVPMIDSHGGGIAVTGSL